MSRNMRIRAYFQNLNRTVESTRMLNFSPLIGPNNTRARSPLKCINLTKNGKNLL